MTAATWSAHPSRRWCRRDLGHVHEARREDCDTAPPMGTDVTRQMQAQRDSAAQQARELAELERFQRLTAGGKLKMIDLKKQIEYLKQFVPDDGGGPR